MEPSKAITVLLNMKKPDPSVLSCMATWLDVIACWTHATEHQILSMLYYEVTSATPRRSVVDRLHGKYTRLRAQRERQELQAYIDEVLE